MLLQRLAFRRNESHWECEPIDFFPDLTLLVGVSGVGKTRILNSISTLKDIISNDPDRQFWGISWDVTFLSDDRQTFKWTGEFENRSSSPGSLNEADLPFEDDDDRPKSRILREMLTENEKVLFERVGDNISLRGGSTPKLPPHESLVKILNQEDGISSAYSSIHQLLFVDHSEDMAERRHYFYPANLSKVLKKYTSIELIRNSGLPTIAKIALTHENSKSVFTRIVEQFCSVFPHVESIRLQPEFEYPSDILPPLQIKEKGVDTWIDQYAMSSGMLRTLLHIGRMNLWPDGTVILVDEFENSLGVNCIDFIAQNMKDESRHLQFILTSHHPYIINNISPNKWKVVTRRGSKVTTYDAEQLGIGRSRHEAFLQLINNPKFVNGVTAA